MLEPLEKIILSALQTIFDQFGWWGVFGLMIFENATGITPRANSVLIYEKNQLDYWS